MPLAIDLFCGLGGWTDGLVASGWEVVGFDIEDHRYGKHRYPAQLVIQDVLTLHGSQFRDADLIVASPPCQEFSYMAMPWSRAKAKIAEIEACPTQWLRLCSLFDACFRIQEEACTAAGRHIPLIVENVRGAQRWVGRSRWNFGSFHLWGDVPALMPMTKAIVSKTKGHPNIRDGHAHTKHLTNPSEHCDCENPEPDDGVALVSNECPIHNLYPKPREDIKNTGGSWFNIGSPGQKETNMNPVRDHIKQGGDWFNAAALDKDGAQAIARRSGSKSNARKAASAMIAKIPFALSSYIGRVFML